MPRKSGTLCCFGCLADRHTVLGVFNKGNVEGTNSFGVCFLLGLCMD